MAGHPGHFKQVCRLCGTTIAQCRCPEPNKPIEYVQGCSYCPKEQQPATEVPGAFVVALPLPAVHWLMSRGPNIPPMPFRIGTNDPLRAVLVMSVQEAARYAVRAATMNGTIKDFDPDALVQNMVVGLLGYFTPDGTTATSNIVRGPDPRD